MFKEIMSITSGSNINVPTPRLYLHTKDFDFEVVSVLAIDMESDYIKNWTDYITVEVSMSMAMYRKVVISGNETVLEATLKNGVGIDDRYRAILLPTNDLPNVDTLDSIAPAELDNSLVTLGLQLVNLTAEAVSMAVVNNVYVKSTRVDILRSMVNEVGEQLSLGYPIEELSVSEGDNDEIVEQLLIDSNSPFLKMAKLLQEKKGGVYYGGINTYIHHYNNKSVCSIYPPLRNRWNTVPEEKRLVAWDLFDKSSNYRERTYDIYPPDSKQVHCIVNKDVKASESREGRATVRSSGIRVVKPEKMMDGYHTVTPGSISTNKDRIDKTITYGSRSDTLDVIENGSTVITSNIYHKMSAIVANKGRTYRFTWQNPNVDLLYPGMPIKVNSVVDGNIIERYGSLIYVYYTNTKVGGLASRSYKTIAYMIIFVEDDTNE